jgi:hypothetical protein
MKEEQFDPKSFLNVKTLSLLESQNVKGGLDEDKDKNKEKKKDKGKTAA